MSPTAARDALARQARRTSARILEAKDRIADPHLHGDEAAELRKTVLDAVGDLEDFAASLLPAADDVNGYAIELLEAIHSRVVT